ncbi:YaaL family protein [Lactobacillus sp. YT155]|uniref:YaaL family protein n=1 Tax=Lactobacillus sp. YT155 TaxID=3060955 RepID=UPI00265EF18A|nr:YaaL family protein [Lactobacillus sp. YT155]MDO1604439.1 YaaL family protein [Lactobacillus sp. YT155]
MFGKKKDYKQQEDSRLLADINKVQARLNNLHAIQDHAVDISQESLVDLKTQEAKYRFLYRQARLQKVKANIQ